MLGIAADGDLVRRNNPGKSGNPHCFSRTKKERSKMTEAVNVHMSAWIYSAIHLSLFSSKFLTIGLVGNSAFPKESK